MLPSDYLVGNCTYRAWMEGAEYHRRGGQPLAGSTNLELFDPSSNGPEGRRYDEGQPRRHQEPPYPAWFKWGQSECYPLLPVPEALRRTSLVIRRRSCTLSMGVPSRQRLLSPPGRKR